MKHPNRRFDHMALRGYGGNLDDAATQVARQLFQAAGRGKGGCHRAHDFVVERFFGPGDPRNTAIGQLWFHPISGQAIAHHGFCVFVQKPRIHQFAHQKPQAARRMERVHIGHAVGVNLGHQRHGLGNLVKICQIQQHARGAGHGGQVQDQVG